MNVILTIAQETFWRLQRDRIYLPAAFSGAVFMIFAGIVSYWGVEEFFEILYDLGTTSYHLTGMVVAIFWGNKLIHDSNQEGSIEMQLAAPISRYQWIIGKYLGLVGVLISLGVFFILTWQGVYLAYQMGSIPSNALLIFGLLTISWLISGAIAILFACISSQALALFMSLSLVVIGLLTKPIASTIASDTPNLIKNLTRMMAGAWDLHFFNLHYLAYGSDAINMQLITSRLIYGCGLCITFISLAMLCFQQLDISPKS